MQIETDDLFKFLNYVNNKGRMATDDGSTASFELYADGKVKFAIDMSKYRPIYLVSDTISEAMDLIKKTIKNNIT